MIRTGIFILHPLSFILYHLSLLRKLLLPSFILHPLSFILLFAGCQQKGWTYREVVSDCPQFNSAQLNRVAENAFSGIEVQFLRGEFGIVGFLNVCSRQIPSGALTVQIADRQYPFIGSVMSGGQRLLLPPAATEMIIQTLLSGQNVAIYLEGFATELCPENFPRKYQRFNQM